MREERTVRAKSSPTDPEHMSHTVSTRLPGEGTELECTQLRFWAAEGVLRLEKERGHLHQCSQMPPACWPSQRSLKQPSHRATEQLLTLAWSGSRGWAFQKPRNPGLEALQEGWVHAYTLAPLPRLASVLPSILPSVLLITGACQSLQGRGRRLATSGLCWEYTLPKQPSVQMGQEVQQSGTESHHPLYRCSQPSCPGPAAPTVCPGRGGQWSMETVEGLLLTPTPKSVQPHSSGLGCVPRKRGCMGRTEGARVLPLPRPGACSAGRLLGFTGL